MTNNNCNSKPDVNDIVDEMDSVCDFNSVIYKTKIPIDISNIDDVKHVNVKDVLSIIDKIINVYCVKIEAINYIVDEHDKGNMHHVSKHDRQRFVSRRHERCCFIKDLTNIKNKIENL